MTQIKNIDKLFYIFLFFHLSLWTLVPSISNVNLPLDTIEALAWASNLEWGFNKHPPLSAFAVGVFYFIFGSNDWAYYLLSQVFVLITFYFVWKLSNEFFSNKTFSLLSLLILETIVFFNYTTPEFNVYVCQLPLKAAAVYFFWIGIKDQNLRYMILTGIFCALGMLTHYSFIFIILSLFAYFVLFFRKNKKLVKYFFISFFIFILILIPHIIWLYENNLETIKYAFGRTGIDSQSVLRHILNPTLFVLKQFGMIILFSFAFISIVSIKKIKKLDIRMLDKKNFFIFCITLMPLIIVFFVSLITGAKIRTMWMSTFYIFFGILFFYYFKKAINLNQIKRFFYILVFLFLLSPITYFYVSITNDFKRTDFPGKEIARLVQNKWEDNFVNEIKIVVGDEWSAGNLSYHLKSRPKWFNELKNKTDVISEDQGVIYTGNPKILKRLCPGVYGTIKPNGYCMIGKR